VGRYCERGWVYVACDHLGCGGSTIPEGNALNYENVARANDATVKAETQMLESGTLFAEYPRSVWPWVLRGGTLNKPTIFNHAELAATSGPKLRRQQDIVTAAAQDEHAFTWCFH
jgi:hypothetical protein